MNSTENTVCDPIGNTQPENVVKLEIDTTKKCRKCQQLKHRSEFYIDKRKVRDKTVAICKSCSDLQHKIYKMNHLHQHKAYEKSYQKDPRNHLNILLSKEKYRKHNKDKCNALTRAWIKHKKKTDPYFRAVSNLRIRLTKALRRNVKSGHTLELLGCSIERLKEHLSSKFTHGMTWNNYGQWHIDHIIPCDAFDLSKSNEQKKCFHYTNLQPLWASDNHRKGAKIL